MTPRGVDVRRARGFGVRDLEARAANWPGVLSK
jgi:hypothetical protein